ncbi:hypothetical protein [Dongia sedimenti]|uniref:Uncharacterized protein n=1 Tax=Dongia sedimenti TaxID=3064282 RepID=A0ABU0YIM5_9PROT|nr:hypothetical protein [Rhodospirillaceae bacterium R-7]
MTQNAPKQPRTIGPEDEDRRTDNPAVESGQVNSPPSSSRDDKRKAREAGVESLPDGADAAAEEAAKARDD